MKFVNIKVKKGETVMNTKAVTFDKVDITGGFWASRQDTIRKTTIWNVYKRFKETGRFDALKLNWKEGDPNKPHIFWDSDVAKWVESVAYLTLKQREPELEAIVDEVVDDIEKGRMADGYFNSCYQQFRKPEERFTIRRDHELYCAGHLLEAAIAYDMATGKGKFLSLMKDYMLFIKKRFIDDQDTAFKSPGHEEIELALVKLYDYTGERVWLDMAVWFIDNHHCTDEECGHGHHGAVYSQSHLPVREQFTAEGHSVRAVYLYCAMADIAERIGDEALKNACEKLFDSIINEKMYITGAIGSNWAAGEAFEEEFRLPNDTAYAETCAALGLALYARRMCRLDMDSKYADTVERVIYNGFLSGMSLDGKAFFYENAQEIDLYQRRFLKETPASTKKLHMPITQRVEVFECSCCPPNITRFIPSIADFIYNYTDDTVYVNQYMESEAEIDGIKLTQKTNYPYDGKVTLKIAGGERKVAFRIPEWCKSWSLKKNGVKVNTETEKGYAFVDAKCCDELVLDLDMQVRVVRASAHVLTNRGMSAVTYGPFVMCMEGVDNGGWLGGVKLLGNYRVGFDSELNVPTVICDAVREDAVSLYSDCIVSEPFTAKLIPYFTFANRGESDMRIWIQA